jgi:uncharacterized protein YecT (DUF1311 family)
MAARLLRAAAAFFGVAAVLILFAGARADDKIDCDNAMNQNDMNICASQDFDRSDAKLNKVYKALVAKLEGKEIDQLKEAQRAWLTYRDAECRYTVRQNEGGSIYPTVWFGCLTQQTETRTKQLQAHLDCMNNSDDCTE